MNENTRTPTAETPTHYFTCGSAAALSVKPLRSLPYFYDSFLKLQFREFHLFENG